jgi:hypothetical protein
MRGQVNCWKPSSSSASKNREQDSPHSSLHKGRELAMLGGAKRRAV